jgi:arylsulfatase A-like enzyme
MLTMKRTALFWLFWLLVPGCWSSGPTIKGGKTNVLLIIVDTLRADHLGTYGYPHDTSQTIDGLAANGVQFEKYFSTSSWTKPGMASMITGEYAREVGVYEEKFDTLPEEATTLAERLQAKGYRTVGVTANPNTNALFGYAQGFDTYSDSTKVWSWMKKTAKGPKSNSLAGAGDITGVAIDLLDTDVVGQKAPFFMQVLYIDPHAPYTPPKKHLKAMKQAGSQHPGYDGGIRFADAQISRLLKALEERNLQENTLVIVTSDHGEGLDSHPNTPNSRNHGTHLYDSNIHVPLILNHPALETHRVNKITSSISLVPTVMDLLGWPIAEGELPGKSAAMLVKKLGGAGLPDKVYAETDWRHNRKVAVRTADTKYIRNDDCKLFQETGAFEGTVLSGKQRAALTNVPTEEFYVVGERHEDVPRNGLDKAKPKQVNDLRSDLTVWEKKTKSLPPLNRSAADVTTLADGTVIPTVKGEGDAPVIDEATMESLRALGYMD